MYALDLGCGCGVLALMAARAGADTVTALEPHPSLAAAARKNVALNGLSDKVRVGVAVVSVYLFETVHTASECLLGGSGKLKEGCPFLSLS